MKITTIIAIIGFIWLSTKLLKAKNVKGKKALIKPYRRESKLKSLGVITVTLDQMYRNGDEIWFICPLNEEKKIGTFTFDYVKIKPKSVDDNFNTKKGVIAYVFAGHLKSDDEPKFIDWGFVEVI